MNELIKISDYNGKRAVSARELYNFLGYEETQFSRWFDSKIKLNEYAVENIDYQYLDISVEMPNGGLRIIKDCSLTIDFAKKLSMMARTKKGEEARDYFVEMEKIFSLGDTTNCGVIWKFEIINDGIYAYFHGKGKYKMGLNVLKKGGEIEPLFTTTDGVDIFEGDEFYSVRKYALCYGKFIADSKITNDEGDATFSTLQRAKGYIDNKMYDWGFRSKEKDDKQFTKEDMIDFATACLINPVIHYLKGTRESEHAVIRFFDEIGLNK